MMNAGRYDGGYVAGGDVPQSPNTIVSQYVASAQESAFPNEGAEPAEPSPTAGENRGATREEREAQGADAAHPIAGDVRAGFTPGFYAGFRAPEPQTNVAGPSTTGVPSEAAKGGAAGEVEEQEPTIEELLSKVVIHTHKPIENLPTISPPELKIIGRAVTFKGETKMGEDTVMMHYEGLVGTINKDTVMLIHVHRFTEEDYQIHKLEVTEQKQSDDKEEKTKGGAERDTAPPTDAEVSAAVEAATSPRSADHARENLGSLPQSAPAPSPHVSEADGLDMGRSHLVSSPIPLLPNAITGDDHHDTNQRVRNRLRNHTGSMGPIPFMTFSRAHIHQVEFARDPRSDFYSLFQDPTKKFFDMQCLRMFCRRYIIHTAQGNNPRQIPLRAFVTCRCHCPDLDNDLLTEVTREEIAHLVKVHRDVQRAKKRKDSSRRNVLRMYRAPPGLFRNTGVLYLTHIPKQTFLLGILEVVMTLVVALYAAISLSSTPLLFVRGYVNGRIPYILPGILFGATSAFFAVMHAVRMSLPLSTHFWLASMRILVVTCAIATNLMTMITIGNSFKAHNVRTAFAQSSVGLQCAYFRQNLCLGFDGLDCAGIDNGNGTSTSSPLSLLCGCAPPGAPPCRYLILGSVERTMIPIVCFTLVLFILLIFDHFLHYKLFYVGRLLAQRM